MNNLIETGAKDWDRSVTQEDSVDGKQLQEKMFHIISHLGNAHTNHSEIPPHTQEDSKK